MKISETFSSKYVRASDLQGNDVVVVIDRVEMEDVGREKEEKAVVYFKGKDKGMVLNKTNANAITKLYGDETSAWKGKAITLFPTETDFGGETVECIRVRLKAPTKKGAVVVEPEPSENPNDLDDSEVPF